MPLTRERYQDLLRAMILALKDDDISTQDQEYISEKYSEFKLTGAKINLSEREIARIFTVLAPYYKSPLE